jgi:hypothetical protein
LARAATARAIAVALGSLPHDVPVAFWFVTRPSEAVLLQRNKPIPPPPCGLAKRRLRTSAHRLSQRTPPSGCRAQWQTECAVEHTAIGCRQHGRCGVQRIAAELLALPRRGRNY